MLRLTPFKETDSFKEAMQEVLQEVLPKELQSYSTHRLIRQIKRKYRLAESTMTKLSVRLRQLTLPDLEALFEAIFDLATLRELNEWINARLPPPPNIDSSDQP